ncbi:MAG: DegT/DnrJ/EryC1/StrS family aminotransferase [bacterium]
MRIPFIDLKRQYDSIKTEIDSAIAEVINAAAFIGGPHVESFERAFAGFCNTKHCIGVANGTDALYLALRALNVGREDEVITAANSFIATSEAITMAGAKAVFVDIDPGTYNINVDKIAEKITPRTKVIVPVHLYGQPADMDPILDLARRHQLIVVEDAAQAHGALYRGRRIGTFGDIACFSFYPGKNLGAYGDAGALVTNDDGLALKARMIANHGRRDKYDHEIEGVNSRLDGMQAAVLQVKLRHLSEWNENRRKNAAIYNDLLRNTGVSAPVEIDNVTAVYHLYVIRVKHGRRQQLQEHLRSRGIDTGIHYPIALPNLKAYAYLAHAARDFPEATRASQEILSLPMFPELEELQIEYIAKAISEFSAHFTDPERTA